MVALLNLGNGHTRNMSPRSAISNPDWSKQIYLTVQLPVVRDLYYNYIIIIIIIIIFAKLTPIQ